MGRGYVGVNARARRAGAALVVVLVLVAIASGCGEQRAERLYAEAGRRVEKGDLAGAIERYQRIVSEFPESRAAERAKSDLVLYRGLLEASRRFPLRRAGDLVVQTARGIERFHREKGRWPSSLQDLVPQYLSSQPVDPWGRPLDYQAKAGGGYLLRCRGADGADGGEGESADVVVEDGRFVKGSADRCEPPARGQQAGVQAECDRPPRRRRLGLL